MTEFSKSCGRPAQTRGLPDDDPYASARLAEIEASDIIESEAIETVEDVVELAIERALEEKSALEIVRSGAARRLMTFIGPMAGMLRW